MCRSNMEREREIPDVFDVFAIGKSPFPLEVLVVLIGRDCCGLLSSVIDTLLITVSSSKLLSEEHKIFIHKKLRGYHYMYMVSSAKTCFFGLARLFIDNVVVCESN